MSNTSTTDQSRNEANYCLGNLAGRPEGRGSAAFSKIVNSHRIKDAFFLGTWRRTYFTKRSYTQRRSNPLLQWSGRENQSPRRLENQDIRIQHNQNQNGGNPPPHEFVDRQPEDFAVTGTGVLEAGTDLKEAGNNGLCNRRLCSSRNGDREGEGESDWLCSSSSSLSWRSTGDSAEDSRVTREDGGGEAEAARLLELETKTEVGTRLSTRCHHNRNQTHRRKGQRNLVLFFIGRHWRIGTGNRNRISSMKEQEERNQRRGQQQAVEGRHAREPYAQADGNDVRHH